MLAHDPARQARHRQLMAHESFRKSGVARGKCGARPVVPKEQYDSAGTIIGQEFTTSLVAKA